MRISVRELVEFVLKSGDLQAGANGPSRTVEGIKAHQFIQKAYGEEYQPEVRLSYTYDQNGMKLEIHGRADGIIQKESGVCIDEIKSTTREFEQWEESFSEIHWAQVKCYAYIYAEQERLETIEVQLTYYQLNSGETRISTRSYSLQELARFFIGVVERYLYWAKKMESWTETQNLSIHDLVFPYPSYRSGQRELVIAVYKTIKQGQRLFAQAPTGIGKTVATLFPALKAVADGLTHQIFYLTAKTMTRTVAEKTLSDLQNRGLKIKRLTLTAKDKVCLAPDNSCDPEECPYARGYYDRVRLALEEIFEEDSWTRTIIEDYSRKHSVCPFEFSLDLTQWADIVICDYNYVFDPRVYLRRLFLEGGDYLFLVDEAHNLVDRAREMFSAEIVKEPFLKLKKEVQTEYPQLGKRIQKVNTQLNKFRKDQTQDFQKAPPTELYSGLQQFIKAAERFLQEEKSVPWKEELLDLYYNALGFLRTAEYYDEHYITLYKQGQEGYSVKLYCLDPSLLLAEAFKRGRAAILFSATLSPIEYFMKILGGEPSSYKLRLSSPFPPQNLCLMLHPGISTRFTQRDSSYDQLAEVIATVAKARTGNYLVFFPSYVYMQKVYERFKMQNQKIRSLVQTQGMTEDEREIFLSQFQEDPQETLVGFSLLGGIFGEGIDLTGSRLSGAVIVGVGLPQICLERDLIRDYFQTTLKRGFEYAYVYPGFNKVLQAAGRVIRTEKDRGAVVLVDERFARSGYQKLFPHEWQPLHFVSNLQAIEEQMRNFWKETN
ncbi:ATP-dependent DNA helicase [Desulfitobacterium sp.]|uniref:ATP-dependent DNA helicase n=1 Tax=Desulfitobacterium sp. TaxID=49981 RepID=UPI002B219F86|nr:ATP-dependent DNA helicase [Desulfitobacterium sp.]MEA4902784.1 ATP-dependent DNA helicase [Desulfitobacterium sp.]